jgi:hypothetical protein
VAAAGEFTDAPSGNPADALELEANRVAAAVTKPAERVHSTIAALCLPPQHSPAGALDSPGMALPEADRSLFEARFGLGLDVVRIHTGPASSRAAAALNAQAFAIGRDIYFAAGRYDPHSVAGQRLVAHELTHVIQQSGGNTSRPGTPSVTPGRMELRLQRATDAPVRPSATTVHYDDLCDASGSITDDTWQRVLVMLHNPDQVDQMYADAVDGNQRAANFARQIEVTFEASGHEVARRTGSLWCQLPVVHELAGCIPNWSYLDFLRRERPGGRRLREVIGDAFQAEAKEIHLKNQIILNALIALGALTAAARFAHEPVRVPAAEPSPPPEKSTVPSTPETESGAQAGPPAPTTGPTPTVRKPEAGKGVATPPKDESKPTTPSEPAGVVSGPATTEAPGVTGATPASHEPAPARPSPERSATRGAQKRERLLSMGGPRRSGAQWFLRNVDQTALEASQRGYQVYEYYAQDGECLYVGKAGGAGGAKPTTWVDRGWDHIQERPEIAEADRIVVRADLTDQEAFALEQDRIAELKPRLNKIPGEFTKRSQQEAADFSANVQAASKHTPFTFRTDIVPRQR